MQSKFENTANTASANNDQLGPENVKLKVEKIEAYFKMINGEITANHKLFDDIKLQNKQAYQTINRNLDDIKEIYEKDLTKFEQSVDKSINYNEAIFQRVEKDAHFLYQDQDNLRKKIILMEKRIDDMEAQIGNMSYS